MKTGVEELAVTVSVAESSLGLSRAEAIELVGGEVADELGIARHSAIASVEAVLRVADGDPHHGDLEYDGIELHGRQWLGRFVRKLDGRIIRLELEHATRYLRSLAT